MYTFSISRTVVFMQLYFEKHLVKKQAKVLNSSLWIALSVLTIYGAGYRAGESIGQLIYNLSH